VACIYEFYIFPTEQVLSVFQTYLDIISQNTSSASEKDVYKSLWLIEGQSSHLTSSFGSPLDYEVLSQMV